MIYSPAEDSFLIEKEVRKYSKNKKILDIGAGSGILSKAAKNSGAKSVLASELDKEAIKHLEKEGIQTIPSYLFKNIKGKFDMIIFNPPYLPLDNKEDFESRKATTGGKKGDEIILEFLKQSKKHLMHAGLILIVISSLTPKKRIYALLKELKLKKEIVSSERYFMEEIQVWKITLDIVKI